MVTAVTQPKTKPNPHLRQTIDGRSDIVRCVGKRHVNHHHPRDYCVLCRPEHEPGYRQFKIGPLDIPPKTDRDLVTFFSFHMKMDTFVFPGALGSYFEVQQIKVGGADQLSAPVGAISLYETSPLRIHCAPGHQGDELRIRVRNTSPYKQAATVICGGTVIKPEPEPETSPKE